jgi:hypothetical protein
MNALAAHEQGGAAPEREIVVERKILLDGRETGAEDNPGEGGTRQHHQRR